MILPFDVVYINKMFPLYMHLPAKMLVDGLGDTIYSVISIDVVAVDKHSRDMINPLLSPSRKTGLDFSENRWTSEVLHKIIGVEAHFSGVFLQLLCLGRKGTLGKKLEVGAKATFFPGILQSTGLGRDPFAEEGIDTVGDGHLRSKLLLHLIKPLNQTATVFASRIGKYSENYRRLERPTDMGQFVIKLKLRGLC